MNNTELTNKIIKLTEYASFTSKENKADYFIHRVFYILQENNLINIFDSCKFNFNENQLKKSYILPKKFDIEEYFNEKLIYSQEYKCHYLVKCVKKENKILFSIKKDTKTVPKIIYEKEYSTLKVLQEIRK